MKAISNEKRKMLPDWHDLADPEMIEWCARLNAILGAETLQSCSGHKVGDVGKCEGVYRYEANGHLWLACDWITRKVAFDLARIATMEQVRLIFFPEGNAVWDLVFAGNNKGLLDESMSEIVRVLCAASEKMRLGQASISIQARL